MVQRREASPGTWSGVRSIKILCMKAEMYKNQGINSTCSMITTVY